MRSNEVICLKWEMFESTHLILLVPSCIIQCHASFLLHYFLNRHELPAQPLPKGARALCSTNAKSDASFLLRRSIKWTWPWTTAIVTVVMRRLGYDRSMQTRACELVPVARSILGGPLLCSGPSVVSYIHSLNDVTSDRNIRWTTAMQWSIVLFVHT